MARVAGVICSSSSSNGNARVRGAVINLADGCAGELVIEPVHGIGRPRDQYLAARIDVGINEELNRFIGAIGERQLIDSNAKVAGQILQGVIVFGVDAEISGRYVALDEIEDMGRSADGVLVEIEAQFVAAAAGGRMVRIHAQYRFPRSERG